MVKRYWLRMLGVLGIAALLAFPLQAAKKAKTGQMVKNIYYDLRFGFAVALPDDWKTSRIRDEYNTERLIMVQKNPQVPTKLKAVPESAVAPTIMFFADSTFITPTQFFEFLQTDTGKSQIKEEIIRKSTFLDRGTTYRFEIINQLPKQILGRPAMKMEMRMKYDAEAPMMGGRETDVGRSTSSKEFTLVRDFRMGYIYLIPFEGWLMYIEIFCENQFFDSLQPVFDQVINSLKFEAPAETMEKKEG